ncbi:SIMPL domain-containing protein [Verrucomicrobiota bacterium]
MKLNYLIVAMLILTSPTLAQEAEQSQQRTISVSGTAVGYAVPDTIIWKIELSTTQEDVLKAKQVSDEQVKVFLKILHEKGISGSQIDTGLIRIKSDSSSKSSTRRSTTTTVLRNITVRQVGLSNFAEMMKTLGNSMRSRVRYEFVSSKFEQVNREVIAKAVGAAKAKADAMAKTVGATVGRVMNIYEYAPPEWGVYGEGIPKDIPSDVHSPDAKKIAHTTFVMFELK